MSNTRITEYNKMRIMESDYTYRAQRLDGDAWLNESQNKEIKFSVMSVRNATCRDCLKLRYYFVGKSKRHVCLLFNDARRLKDRVCSVYGNSHGKLFNASGIPGPRP